MTDTKQNTPLPAGVWVDLYQESTILIGTQILAENLTDKPVRLYAGLTPPVNAGEDNGLGSFSRLIGYDEKINSTGDLGAWALAEVGGLINVKVVGS